MIGEVIGTSSRKTMVLLGGGLMLGIHNSLVGEGILHDCRLMVFPSLPPSFFHPLQLGELREMMRVMPIVPTNRTSMIIP